MSESTEPPWQWLPNHPRRFFGLADDAGQEELKATYGQLIRRFKPDRFPEEFKKIRAAYERFLREIEQPRDSALRLSEFSDLLTYETHTSEPGTPIETGDTVEFLTERSIAYQRCLSQESAAWYEELRSKENRSLHDYFVLALLSDLVETDERTFVDWIAQAVEEHPLQYEFRGLLDALLRSSEGTNDAAPLLERLSRSMSPLVYYTATKSLWLHYAKSAPWKDVDALLKQCEQHLGSSAVFMKLDFTIAMMRRVMWRAPIEWLRDKQRWIESGEASLEPWIEFQHELNCKLLELREKHLDELGSGRFGTQIRNAIRAFCEETEADAVAAICNCQAEMAANPRELLQEFPYVEGKDLAWLYGWAWICWNAQSKLASQEPPAEAEQVAEAIVATMQRIDAGFPRWIDRKVQWINLAAAIGFVLIALITLSTLLIALIATLLFFFGTQSEFYLWLTLPAIVLGGLLVIVVYFRVSKIWTAKVIHPMIRRHVLYQYQRKWRLPIARMMQTLVCPFSQLNSTVDSIAIQPGNRLGASRWLRHFLGYDRGLILYNTALPFVR